jgi:uncharacterized protein (DUF885 family)
MRSAATSLIRVLGVGFVLGLALASPCHGASAAAQLDRLTDEYFERTFEFHPQEATQLGNHNFDHKLLPITQASVASNAAWLRDLETRLRAIPLPELKFDQRLDHATLLSRIERDRLDLEVVKPQENNPTIYVRLITSSIQSLLQRNFAPVCSRSRAAADRLRAVPEVLRAAEINLRRPARVATEVAIDQVRGALRFYRETVPALTADCRDPGAAANLAEADTAAVRATQEFLRFLEEDLRPRSDGSYALGTDVYQRKLWADEMEGAPVESLLARGRREIETTHARMRELAAHISPDGVQAALDSIARDHPTAEQLVPFVAADLDSIRAFVRDHHLLTVPAHEHLIVRETPAFARGLSFASMDAPGVWETGADEAYFNVTPVEPGWTAKQKEDHLAFFNRYNARIVAVHEALPGHYYQFLARRHVRSRVRAALGCGSNIEGWAHYCEQMAVEEGFAAGDARVELAQQWLALQRLGRLVAGLSMHTGGMTEAEAAQLFETQCWMTPVTAEREARRGTLDPTYLVYTLGKWRLLDLRDEVRAAMGARYTARAFHDAVLAQGVAPLPIVRAGVLEALTGHATPPEER